MHADRCRPSRRRRWTWLLGVGAALLLAWQGLESAQPRFLVDDPLAREPETQDASKAQAWDIDLYYDLLYNLFVTPRRPPSGLRAQNVNTIDEVPDSSWFTNRIGARALSTEEVVRGPNAGPAPDESAWTVIREKSSGFAPGFTARDAAGQTWFVSFDTNQNPEGATGAIVIATKIFWALGYHQVENFLATIDPANLRVDERATARRPNGTRSPMTDDDVHIVLERSRRGRDGTYRVAVGRLLPGRVIGGFRYEGTRSDDPNDLVPHEHRRELRALRVFGAWTNLTDMKAGNTLDSVITEGGRGTIRHYLQDVGSTFGVGAVGPHDWHEGYEYVWEAAAARRRLFTFGFALGPWQGANVPRDPAVGRFEAETFDPDAWKPRAPTRAYLEMRDDDAFWAARRVMAFSDDLIRAIVATARFSNPRSSERMAATLIARRDRIGQAYLPRINPIVEPAFDGARVRFANAAVDHRVASAPSEYRAVWYRYDNTTDTSTRVGETSGRDPAVAAPSGLPEAPGAFVRVDLSARHPEHSSWSRPVEAYFRRDPAGWKLVGLERLPDQEPE